MSLATLRRRVSTESDRGLSLIEVLVTMILLAVVSSLVVTAVGQAGRILIRTDDEATGLGDAKVIFDRLGRDIREARAAECDGGLADPTAAATEPGNADGFCAAHLQLWIDANSDYIRQDTEIITWRLQRNPDGIHFDVWRFVGTGAGGSPVTSQRQASSLIVRIAFKYPDFPGGITSLDDFDDVQQVDMSIRYDAFLDRGTEEREVAFSARLRNKG